MGVVVPWSPRLFQHTVKDVARPAVGRLWVDGTEHVVAVGESWAVLDHGRGRWPYSVRWTWGAGSGVVEDEPRQAPPARSSSTSPTSSPSAIPQGGQLSGVKPSVR